MKNKILLSIFLSFVQYSFTTGTIFSGLNYFLNGEVPVFIIAAISFLIGILGAWLHYLLKLVNVKNHFMLVTALITIEAFIFLASLFYFINNNYSIYRIALQSLLGSLFVAYCVFKVLLENQGNARGKK